MADIGTLVVKITSDISGLTKGLEDAQSKVSAVGKGMQKAGAGLTAGVTAPLLGLGAVSAAAATSFSTNMANVQTLLTDLADGGTARTQELGQAVQTMAMSTGKSTEDLAGGLYQVVSAFGDSADTVKILDINARAAAAGLATTEQAIALTSAVTKGYGDTSAEAVQKASDLAFQTVKLGQTTFPELASSMGNVVPLASALGVSQEELAAQFATLTGVTGSASEVSTQLRATYQAILKPTADMGAAISSVAAQIEAAGQLVDNQFTQSWQDARQTLMEVSEEFAKSRVAMTQMEAAGQTSSQTYKDLAARNKELGTMQKEANKAVEDAAAALGQSIVQSVGYDQALQMLAATADGNTNTLGKMFGSVESLNAVLALSGPQADSYAEKLAAMNAVTGASDAAFAAQTEGVGAAAFQMQQMRQQMTVVAQDLGAALIPALSAAMTAAQPLIAQIAALADAFASADPKMQSTILAIAGVAAAIGPVLMVVGTMVTGISGLASAFGLVAAAVGPVVSLLGVILNPITLVAAAVGGLLAVLFNWGGANDRVAQSLQNWGLEGAAEWVRSLHEGVTNLTTAVGDFFSGETSFAEFFDAVVPDWITTLFSWAWPVLGPIAWIVKLTSWTWPSLSKPSWIQKLLDFRWPKFPSLPGWMGGNGGDAGNNAAGTPRWRGGLTWVGEEGPELVNLPRGTQIFPADVSASMANGMGGGGLTIAGPLIGQATIRNDDDVRKLAQAVARELKILSM